MKLIIAMSLFIALLFFSGFARALPFQGPAEANHMGACCRVSIYEPVFTNPHTGWISTPVEAVSAGCSCRR